MTLRLCVTCWIVAKLGFPHPEAPPLLPSGNPLHRGLTRVHYCVELVKIIFICELAFYTFVLKNLDNSHIPVMCFCSYLSVHAAE